MGKISSLNGRSVPPVFLILISFCIKLFHAKDTLLQNEVITDGQTLVSAGKIFELGFFSPGNSSNRYVGIWYHKIPKQTVVWIGNRNSPVIDYSGYLEIDSSGSLMILDGRGSIFMKVSGSGSTPLQATLLDSGNFILRQDVDNSSQVFWQSFDMPTDTLLYGNGMKLALRGRQNQVLTSWKSLDDPAAGIYSFGIDPSGTNQLLVWQRGYISWTSGVWDRTGFTLAPELQSMSINPSFNIDGNSKYLSMNRRCSDCFERLVMDMAGQVGFSVWLDSEEAWILFWAQPRKYQCETPSYCGANSLCNKQTSQPCRCMYGFGPDSSRQWESGDWSGGCVRRAQLECGKGDGFLQVKRVKLPVSISKFGNLSTGGVQDCKDKCTSDCSCIAYASAHENGTGCLMWFGDLFGLQENYDGAQDLYIRLLASELSQGTGKDNSVTNSTLDHRKKTTTLWIMVATGVTGTVLLSSAFVCFLRRRKLKRTGKKDKKQDLLLYQIVSNLAASDANKHGETQKGTEFSVFSFGTIVAATDNFSTTNKLGQGGFGPVYKGKLSEGADIAVKRLSESSGQGYIEFQNEIVLIAKLQHTNLVRLFGCCIQGEEKILVYEYLPNKSLDFYIFDPNKGAELDWSKRFHIIEGIAQGLLYLHKYSRLRIIHRDLKASNILLDIEMNPKISDFGMARIFGRNESQVNTSRVVGTHGYMSPEYVMEGLFSEKSDVFSFGVLLLEIVSGKRNTSFHHSGLSLNLLGYAWELWNDGRVLDMMDPLLADSCPTDELPRCIHVALLCVQQSAIDRPNMSTVVSLLSSETASLPNPKQPAFTTGRTTGEADLTSRRPAICSLNIVTVSGLEGR